MGPAKTIERTYRLFVLVKTLQLSFIRWPLYRVGSFFPRISSINYCFNRFTAIVFTGAMGNPIEQAPIRGTNASPYTSNTSTTEGRGLHSKGSVVYSGSCLHGYRACHASSICGQLEDNFPPHEIHIRGHDSSLTALHVCKVSSFFSRLYFCHSLI